MELADPKDIIYIPNDDTVKAVAIQTDAPIIAVKRGEIGYWPIYTHAKVEDLNGKPLTEEEMHAAVTCSMFGWHESKLSRPILDWLAARDAEMDRACKSAGKE